MAGVAYCSLFFFLQKSSTSGDNWFGFCSNQIDTSFQLEKVWGSLKFLPELFQTGAKIGSTCLAHLAAFSPKNLFKYSFQSTQVFTGVTNPKNGPNLEVEKFFLKIKRVTKFFKKWDAWFARSLKRCRLQGPMKHNYAALQKSFESQSTQCQQTILVKKIGMQRSMSAMKFLCLFPSLGKMKF